MIDYVIRGKYDKLYTPECVVYPLLKYLPKPPLMVWECCDEGKSKISYVLRKHGYNVISTDIITGFDFLKDKPYFMFDMIITNPPYSLKNEFIKKCYEYGKPFALLLPITSLEGRIRGEMFRKYGISVIVLDRRVDFTRKKRNWFNVSWFIWKIGENNRIYFESLTYQNI
jgi:hypothetical protein